MKKFLKIFAVVILVLILLIVSVPILFKGPILKLVQEKINENVNATVTFDDFNLSLLKGFPDLYIELTNLKVVGKAPFENDTLASFKLFSIKADIMSAIKDKDVVVKAVIIDELKMYAHVLPDGKANWDIAMPTDSTVVEEPVDTTASSVDKKLKLKKFLISNASIRYVDESSNLSASLDSFNFLLAGNLAADITNLDIVSSIQKINVTMDGIKYLKNASFNFKSLIEANMNEMLFTFKENEMSLNQISLMFEGLVQMKGDDILTDIKFNTNKPQFKSLLSMVPAIYMKDFEQVKTDGTLSLKGFVKGTYNEKITPSAGINLLVENASFSYPDMPKNASNIQIDLNAFYHGVIMDSSYLDIKKFHVELGGNPFDFGLGVRTPESDMQISAFMKGVIDFASLKELMPIDANISGILSTDITLMGYMSAIEQEKYESFDALGNLSLKDFAYAGVDFPLGVKIKDMNMEFSPKYVDLKNFESFIGTSDIQLKGKIENFIPFVFSDSTIKGTLTLTSNKLDVNPFMTEDDSAATTTTTDTASAPLTVVEVPGNIDFTFTSAINTLIYDNINMTNVLGQIIVRNKTVALNNLSMNLLEGSMVMNGKYSTEDIKNPSVDLNLAINQIDIPSAYNTFNTVQKLAPIAKNCQGKISINFDFSTFLLPDMMPKYESMVGSGMLSSQNIVIGGTPLFNKIADALKNDDFKKFELKDFKAQFEIKNGRVELKPFDTKISDINMSIFGSQGIDQTMDFTFAFAVPSSKLGGAANQAMASVIAKAAGQGIEISAVDKILVDVLATGTATDPKLDVKFRDLTKGAVSNIKDQVVKKVEQEVKKIVDDGKAKAKEQADKLIAAAESEAAKIKAAARTAADAVKAEADKQASDLIKKANNPIAKKAAEVSATQIRKTAESKSNQIISEGDNQANAVIQRARNEAAKLQ